MTQPHHRRASRCRQTFRRRRRRAVALALAVLGLALAAFAAISAGGQKLAATRPGVEAHVLGAQPGDEDAQSGSESAPPDDGQPGRDDGYVAVGESISPFDDGAPAVARLRPQLRSAIQRAAADARADGIELGVTSGWRSARYQQLLLDRAVETYDGIEVARQYVNTPQRSTHVRGEAVDVGPTDADSWLSQHGAGYGLCQTYANEMWHFELATAPGGTCPPQIADAAAG